MLIDSSAKLQQLQINDHQENVEEPLDDKNLLELCLSTMSQSLKQDICDLRKPDSAWGGWTREDTKGDSRGTPVCLPPLVRPFAGRDE